MPGLPLKAPAMLLDRDAPLFLRWRYLPRLMPWLIPFLRNATIERAGEIAAALAVLTGDTVDQHRALADGTAAADHIRTGDFVALYRSRADFDRDALSNRLRAAHGFVPDPLSRGDILARDPNIGPRYGFGARFAGYGWLSSPAGYVAALFDHFCRRGGQFRRGEVVAITPGPDPSVTLAGGTVLGADKIVLAAGAWSARLAATMAVPVRLESERGYHLSMMAPAFSAPHPYMITDAKFVLTPMQGYLRAAGIVEFAGTDALPSAAPVALIRRHLRHVYPALEYESCQSWMGRRPTTPDSLPVVGESASAPGILHAYGGQHIGVTIAPKIGRIVADLAAGRRINLDLSPYRVDRFRTR